MLDTLSSSQLERLQYIDFLLQFAGKVRRLDLQTKFGMQTAAATRDLRLYRDLWPDNMVYQAKTYLRSDHYVADERLSYPFVMALLTLEDHVDKTIVGDVAFFDIGQHKAPSLDVLSALSRAIVGNYRATIEYISVSSGESTRVITPIALVNTGLRWHVRAFDKKRARFSDFVVNRIKSVTVLATQSAHQERSDSDHQWNRMVRLNLVPHPDLVHPEAILLEHKMLNGRLEINVRAALVGYFLNFWKVDCSLNHSLPAPFYNLWLSNIETLYDVENLSIAPGYQVI
jgi:hypothetical protein